MRDNHATGFTLERIAIPAHLDDPDEADFIEADIIGADFTGADFIATVDVRNATEADGYGTASARHGTATARLRHGTARHGTARTNIQQRRPSSYCSGSIRNTSRSNCLRLE